MYNIISLPKVTEKIWTNTTKKTLNDKLISSTTRAEDSKLVWQQVYGKS